MEAPPTAETTSISWTGVVGGTLGFLIMAGLAVAVAAGSSEASRWWSVPMAGLGAIFVAAAWVSVRSVASRARVLKTIVVVVMVLAVIGAPIYGVELLLVLAPATALLAQAAGFIFQGRR